MPAQVILEFEGITTKEYDAVNNVAAFRLINA